MRCMVVICCINATLSGSKRPDALDAKKVHLWVKTIRKIPCVTGSIPMAQVFYKRRKFIDGQEEC